MIKMRNIIVNKSTHVSILASRIVIGRKVQLLPSGGSDIGYLQETEAYIYSYL